MKLKLGTTIAVGLLAATMGFAQMGGGQMGGPGGGGQMGGGPGGPGGQRDVFMQEFFQPDFVMNNQQELALSEEQETVIKEAMKEMMGEFSSLQWEQTEAKDALGELTKTEVIDQDKVLAQLDTLLAVEGKIKRLQVTSMIKVRNVLTAEQIAVLKEKKKAMRPMGMGGGMGRGPKPPMEPPVETAAEPEVTEPAPTEATSSTPEPTTP